MVSCVKFFGGFGISCRGQRTTEDLNMSSTVKTESGSFNTTRRHSIVWENNFIKNFIVTYDGYQMKCFEWISSWVVSFLAISILDSFVLLTLILYLISIAVPISSCCHKWLPTFLIRAQLFRFRTMMFKGITPLSALTNKSPRCLSIFLYIPIYFTQFLFMCSIVGSSSKRYLLHQ